MRIFEKISKNFYLFGLLILLVSNTSFVSFGMKRFDIINSGNDKNDKNGKYGKYDTKELDFIVSPDGRHLARIIEDDAGDKIIVLNRRVGMLEKIQSSLPISSFYFDVNGKITCIHQNNENASFSNNSNMVKKITFYSLPNGRYMVGFVESYNSHILLLVDNFKKEFGAFKLAKKVCDFKIFVDTNIVDAKIKLFFEEHSQLGIIDFVVDISACINKNFESMMSGLTLSDEIKTKEYSGTRSKIFEFSAKHPVLAYSYNMKYKKEKLMIPKINKWDFLVSPCDRYIVTAIEDEKEDSAMMILDKKSLRCRVVGLVGIVTSVCFSKDKRYVAFLLNSGSWYVINLIDESPEFLESKEMLNLDNFARAKNIKVNSYTSPRGNYFACLLGRRVLLIFDAHTMSIERRIKVLQLSSMVKVKELEFSEDENIISIIFNSNVHKKESYAINVNSISGHVCKSRNECGDICGKIVNGAGGLNRHKRVHESDYEQKKALRRKVKKKAPKKKRTLLLPKILQEFAVAPLRNAQQVDSELPSFDNLETEAIVEDLIKDPSSYASRLGQMFIGDEGNSKTGQKKSKKKKRKRAKNKSKDVPENKRRKKKK